jgi:hypothetical protein
VYDRASSETGSPIGLQLFSSFGLARGSNTECAQTTLNDYPLASTACTLSVTRQKVGCVGFHRSILLKYSSIGVARNLLVRVPSVPLF